MATLIQLSETCWLNMDNVTLIRQSEQGWSVYTGAQDGPLIRLTPEEGEALAYYLRHAANPAPYNQTRPRG